MSNNKPVIALTVEEPLTLADIVKWADLAAALSLPVDSPVQVNAYPNRLTVRAFLSSAKRRDPETGRFIKAAS